MTCTHDKRPKMTVNVSLCGSIPRSEMASLSSNPQGDRGSSLGHTNGTGSEVNLDTTNSSTEVPQPQPACHEGSKCSSETSFTTTHSETAFSKYNQSICSSEQTLTIAAQRLSELQASEPGPGVPGSQSENMLRVVAPFQAVEPPHWAVAARGDAHLEPVCELKSIHPPVDLTSRPYFRIGRSPTSDVQLMHATSSRRHAVLFHHPNGACYIVDCGSAHGTFVNGVRVRSTVTRPAGNNIEGDMVVPFRVRRGSLVRFGGPGAPTFILKSFSVGLSSLIRDLGSVSEVPSSMPNLEDYNEDETKSSVWTSRRKETDAAVVLFNTRINAVGGDPQLSNNGYNYVANISTESLPELGIEEDELMRSPKRQISPCTNEPRSKRRCLSEISGDGSKVVSPSISPLRSLPEEDSKFGPELPPPPPLTSTFTSSLPRKLKRKQKRRRVTFSGEKPEHVFAPSVTPDELSDDDSIGIVSPVQTTSIFVSFPPTTPRTLS